MREEYLERFAEEHGATWKRIFCLFPREITWGAGQGKLVWLKHIEERYVELGWGCWMVDRRLPQ